MDLEGIMLGEISETEKDKYYVISLVCGILKKTNKTHRYREETGGYQRLGGEWARGSWLKWVKAVERYKFPVIR